jgi:predicted amidohydrolase
MRIGAYQFSVTGDMDRNFNKIEYAINEAKEKHLF